MKWVRLTLLETAGVLDVLDALDGGHFSVEKDRKDAILLLEEAMNNAVEEEIP